MPGRGGRAPSGPWGRLKPVELDPLESMGLPSKGDTRLLDFKTQEKYYTKIVDRYMKFCSDAGQRDELLLRFSSLDTTSSATTSTVTTKTTSTATGSPEKSTPATDKAVISAASTQNPSKTKALSDVLMALRKLREGIVASKRADDFAIQAYLFTIRLAVLVKQPESYHPAMLHLLRAIHPLHPLTSVELEEVIGYLVLDTACRRGELAEAFALRRRWKLRDGKVSGALDAMAHDNYVAFQRLKRTVDGHKARVMEWAESEMKMHALKCFGRTYLSVELEFLEKTMDSGWDELKTKNGVGWELDGSTVVIRKVKAR